MVLFPSLLIAVDFSLLKNKTAIAISYKWKKLTHIVDIRKKWSKGILTKEIQSLYEIITRFKPSLNKTNNSDNKSNYFMEIDSAKGKYNGRSTNEIPNEHRESGASARDQLLDSVIVQGYSSTMT